MLSNIYVQGEQTLQATGQSSDSLYFLHLLAVRSLLFLAQVHQLRTLVPSSTPHAPFLSAHIILGIGAEAAGPGVGVGILQRFLEHLYLSPHAINLSVASTAGSRWWWRWRWQWWWRGRSCCGYTTCTDFFQNTYNNG